MAEVTALLAGIRQETPPAVPFDPAVASKKSMTSKDADPVPTDGGPNPSADGPETEIRPT
jgi:hypothetical protein